jgi:LysM repeat protein
MPVVEGTYIIYTVRPGDTLYSIARRFGSEVRLIEQTNALFPPVTDPGLIYPGQVLLIPETGFGQRSRISYLVKPGDTLYSIGLRFSATPDLLAGMNPQITDLNVLFAGLPLEVPAFIYSVEMGQSLYRISRELGVPMNEIIQANAGRPGFSPDVLYPNYELIVPLPSSRNILVFVPLPGSVVTPGQALEGIARAFEATIYYQLFDERGTNVITEKVLTVSEGAPLFGTFSTALQFDNEPAASSGELWVYARSAVDNRIIDLVQVKVRFNTA